MLQENTGTLPSQQQNWGYWDGQSCYPTWPYQPVISVSPCYVTVERTVEPTVCMGKAHVFACEHVKTCQCGKIERMMPEAK